MKDWHITLTPSELMLAAMQGVMRQVQNIKLGRKPAHGADRQEDWQKAIEGSCGECAAAKGLGIYWSGNLGKLSLPDVGVFQVRTRSRHEYELMLHDTDSDSAVFILVTGLNGDYYLRGWILGKGGKKKEYWQEHKKGRPAYFVPRSLMHPMESLIWDDNSPASDETIAQ